METKKTGKGGVIAALVALVVVIAVGMFAYGQLSPAATADRPASADSSSANTGASAGARAAGSGESATSSGEAAAPADDAVLLADYNPTVYTQGGTPVSFTDIADGRPLVVNFWATWCPYCIDEMPDYQEIYDEYGDHVAFAFVDAVDGQREKVEDGASWLAENGLSLPAYYDTKREAVTAYGASSLPTTVVADANGEILVISPGRIDPDLMRSALDSLL